MYVFVSIFCCLFGIIDATPSTTCRFYLETKLNSSRKNPIVLFNDDILKSTNRNGLVVLQRGNTIQLLCSGRNNYLISPDIGPLGAVRCVGNNTFTTNFDRRTYRFDHFTCYTWPQPETKNIGMCNRGFNKTSIGFEVPLRNFIRKIDLCFDSNQLITYWEKHQLQFSEGSCLDVESSFRKDHFNDVQQNVNPDTAYDRNGIYNKGHLAPKCDFFTGAEKRMTFYYINTAPQVQQFNQNNWKSLESVIRSAINHNRKRLYIYTGTTHVVGNLKGIPVPQYFWKVVIEDSSGEGVAFIGVNDISQNIGNPCQPSVPCDRINWLGRSFISRLSDARKGKIYCCGIHALKQIANIEVPQFSEYLGGVLVNL